MLYKSSYADLQVLVRAPVVNYHPVTGVEISRAKALRANFGNHGGTFTATDPLNGELVEHAIINGHFFDTEAAAERLEWTEEERLSVEASLDKLAKNQPYLLAKIDLTRPPVAAPWPTYDHTTEAEIAKFAHTLGLVEEALAYEKDNKNRPAVLAGLEDQPAKKRKPGRPRKEDKPPEPDPAAAALGSISLP